MLKKPTTSIVTTVLAGALLLGIGTAQTNNGFIPQEKPISDL